MKAVRMTILSALVLVLAAGVSYGQAPGPHPRLYINAEGHGRVPGVGELRARTSDPAFAAAWARVRESKAPENVALAWLLTGDTTGLAGLRADLRKSMPRYEQLGGQALAFDWAYGAFTPGERQEFAHQLMKSTEEMLKHYSMDCVYHNYSRGPHMGRGLAMLAAWGDDPAAEQQYPVVKRQMDELVEILADGARLDDMDGRAGFGGGWPEGYDYDRHGGFYALQIMLGWRSAGLGDYFDGSRYWRDKIDWLLYGTGPGGKFIVGYEDNDWPFPMRHDREMLTVLAHEYDSPQAAWWCASYADSLAPRPYWELIFADPKVKPAPPEGMPTGRLVPGVGLALMRSSWKGDATFVSFHCGPWYTYHQHANQGSFTVWRGRALVIEPGVYDGEVHENYVNWRIRTISHNSLTVLDTAERYHGPEDVPNPANDGGQTIQNWTLKPSNMAQWREQKKMRAAGQVTLFLNDASHDLAAGEAAGAYAVGKVQRWSRQLLFVKPDWVVLCDLVQAKAEFPKTLYFHSPAELSQSPEGASGAGAFQEFSLLPQGATLRVEGGPGKTFEYGGHDYPGPAAYNDQVDVAWRLMVEAPREERTVYLTALYIPKPGETAAHEAKLLDSSGEQVKLSLDGKYEVTFVPGQPESYSLTGPGVTYCVSGVVAKDGLALEGEKVTLSGRSKIETVTDSHGAFLFQSLAPGDYTITRAATGETRKVTISVRSVGDVRF